MCPALSAEQGDARPTPLGLLLNSITLVGLRRNDVTLNYYTSTVMDLYNTCAYLAYSTPYVEQRASDIRRNGQSNCSRCSQAHTGLKTSRLDASRPRPISHYRTACSEPPMRTASPRCHGSHRLAACKQPNSVFSCGSNHGLTFA